MIALGIEAEPKSSTLAMRLLGGWRLEDDGREVPTTIAMRRLLASLALHGPRHRGSIATLMWPDSTARQAAGSLRELIWRTRQAHPQLLTVTRDSLALGGSVDVDVPALRAMVGTLRHRPVSSAKVVDLCTAGELLPGWSDPWIESEREQLRQIQLVGLELLAGHRLADRCPDEALQIAMDAAAAEPLRESAQRIIVRAHLAMGNYHRAVAQFERYSDLLDDELGVRPSREFAELLRQRVREPQGPLPTVSRINRPAAAFPRQSLAVAVDF